MFQKYRPLLVIAGVIILFDQLTKAWVRKNIPFGEIWSPIPGLEEYARIVHWSNTGAAFGLFQNFSIVFTVLAILVSIAIFYYYPRIPQEEWPLRLALGLQLGGAFGNLIDRLLFGGHVTDFISILNFAVFNFADASISTGVVVLVLGVWIKDRHKPLEEPSQNLEDTPPASDKNQAAEENKISLSEEYLGD